MSDVLRRVVVSSVVAVALCAASPVFSQSRPRRPARHVETVDPRLPQADALPGAIVRWSVPGTTRCTMGTSSWSALQDSCFYPVDLEHKPGVVRVARRGARGVTSARITVTAASYGSENITLGDIPQAHPSDADLQRNAREQVRVSRLWKRREGPARFTLPLAAPLHQLPEGKGFGSLWVFNTTPETKELHSGTDFAAAAGTPVLAVADGTVVMADDLFLAGNAVFVDHGNGLIVGYFHLSEFGVRVGQQVKQGDTLGKVGATGRVTGPHLHLGARWHGARVDPGLLLGDPAKIPALVEVAR